MSAATDLIRRLPAAFDANAAEGADCTVLFAVSQPLHAVISGGRCAVHEGEVAAPDVSITMADDDLVALLTGELNGLTAFMTGKIQVDGDLMLAQRVLGWFDAAKLG